MHVSMEIDYGLRAMIVIASNPEEVLPSKEISKRFNIPYNFLSLILPKLVRNGLVTSIQGPKGGYKLGKPASEITFLEVIEALDGPINLISCNTESSCQLDSLCTMVNVWQNLKKNIEDYFAKITIEQCVTKELTNIPQCLKCE